MLTVFTKTKTRETAEVERARQAMARCLAGALGLTLTVSLAPAARRSA